ncbi:MAG TPA: type II toxin-antitoxin system VapC family toxin [Blastocatellia bacterium]|nr:type II toxin-antitoxin system VapC family toxin [Blastocatellia bacterium]
MKLLLDTHTFLWFAGRQQYALLPQATKDLLEDQANILFLSYASIWELAIKVSIGKMQLTESVADLVRFQQAKIGLQLLPLQLAHLDLIEHLPFHHKDPFDRLLIAQAQVEGLIVVGVDAAFDAYGVNRLWLS